MVDKQKYIVCYNMQQTSSGLGQSMYMLSDMTDYISDGSFDICRLEQDNPGIHVTAIFNEHDNIIALQNKQKDNFNNHCFSYNLEYDDYNRLIVDIRDRSTVYRIVDFIPKNRKYKIRLKDVKTNRHIKASKNFVDTCLAFTRTLSDAQLEALGIVNQTELV